MNKCFCFLYANVGLKAVFEINDAVQEEKKKNYKIWQIFKSDHQLIETPGRLVFLIT